ncbi:hypothetical protein ABPG74_018959 [Tetrahymena malaccensis]
MKNIQFFFASTTIWSLLFALICASHSSTGSNSSSPDIINYNDFSLQFEDYFNQTELNTTIWKVGDNLVRTKDQFQIYTKENVKLKNNSLVISAQYNSTIWKGQKYDYTGGYLDTRGDLGFKFKYGYAEARIKLPQLYTNDSSFPAFWGLPADNSRWHYSVEIDIMEYCNVCSGKDTSTYIYGAYIYGNREQYGDCRIWYRSPMKQLDFTQYHLYGMLWNENEVTFYVDGVANFSYIAKDPSNNSSVGCPIVIPNRDFYLILNFAVIQKFAKPEHYKETKEMYVDYVRVYKSKNQ